MCFKRKEKKVVHNREDADLVEFFPKKIDVLLEFARSDKEKEALKELRFLVENLSVSPKEKVYKIDKDISNSIDDLKIMLVKGKPEESVLNTIVEIRAKVKERDVYYFR